MVRMRLRGEAGNQYDFRSSGLEGAHQTKFGTIRKVTLNRLLRYINLLVAVVLVIALAVVYWFVYRVLPKTSGEIHAPIANRDDHARLFRCAAHRGRQAWRRAVPPRLRHRSGPPLADGIDSTFRGR